MATSIVETISGTNAVSDRTVIFEELVKTYEKPLFQFAYRLCGNHHEAQDLFRKDYTGLISHLPNSSRGRLLTVGYIRLFITFISIIIVNARTVL